MCLVIPRNLYLSSVMEIPSEIESSYHLCNRSNIDQSNWTNHNISQSIIAAPGYTDSTVAVIIVYCILFVIAAAGNLSVVITLFRSRRHRRSRVSLMICHLAVADLMVAFIMIPLEVGWRITVEWHAGNIACKVFLFMRAFCLYLSSNVLVCVSLDRCFAVLYPLRVSAARKRGKIMLAGAWTIALINAVPQSIIFRVQQHPQVPGFMQCVTFGFFSTAGMETAYNLFCVIAMYFLPLMIISGAYSVILCEISNRTNRSKDDGETTTTSTGVLRLRCSDVTHIERAKQRTLRLTVTIVAVFIWCWTPYVVMTLWYMFDRESAVKVDNAVQDGLFLMAVSNSCMNPLVYGSYAMKCKLPCTKEKANDLVMEAATAALQRRSTGGWNGPIAVLQKGTYTKTSNGSKFTGKLDVRKYRELSCQQPTPRIYRCPSLEAVAIIPDKQSIIIDVRPSFHSDPTPNQNFDVASISNKQLTRSLDTRNWR